jgi:nucleoside 2-deoxyribosyltransferase
MLTKPHAYLAAPLFNARERDYNLKLAESLTEHLHLFLPQRDGSLLTNMLEAGVPLIVAQRRVYEQDCKAMSNAHLLIAILDGAHVDEGVAFEIGYMKGVRKSCVGLQTDVRRALPSGNNPMIVGSLDVIFNEESQMISWVSEFAQTFQQSFATIA